jgi:hypothetical protein
MSNNPEDEVEKDIHQYEERKEHLENALDSRLRAQDDIPHIQEELDVTNWQLRALENRPPESSEIPYKSRSDDIEKENQFLIDSYPILDVKGDSTLYASTGSVTASGSPSVYIFVNRVRDLGTPEAIKYGNTYIQEYNQLQLAQGRPERVRMLLEKLNSPNTLERFDRALLGYKKYRSEPKEKIATANHMRNLLYGLQGDLWEHARHSPRETMNWNTMASRLAINGNRGQEYITLASQEAVQSTLISRLSEVLKDREGGSLTDLDSIWVEIQDFIFTVFGLIDL